MSSRHAAWMLPFAIAVAAGCSPDQEVATDCLGRSVVDPLTGTAQLTWVAPTTRSDGSSFNDLSGYRIYYGVEPDQLRCKIEIEDPKAAAWKVTDLSPGTWHFAVVSVDSAKLESKLSGVVSKQID